MTVWVQGASYVMENLTERDISVKMAFVSRIMTLSVTILKLLTVKTGLEIFIGDVVNSYGDPLRKKERDLSFEKLVGSIIEEPYKAENFTATEKGNLSY